MAQIALIVGTNSQYEDGDILVAFNDRRIGHVHAEHVCKADAPFTKAGLRQTGSLFHALCETVHAYRIERVSKTEIDRVTIATGDRVRIDSKPLLIDGVMQHMEVDEFFRRRRQHPKHRVFGTDGAEIYHGGQLDFSATKIDALWTEIEGRGAALRSAHAHWPFTDHEKAVFLALPVSDFADAAALTTQGPQIGTDKNGDPIFKKRANMVNWRLLMALAKRGGGSISQSDVLDRAKIKDTTDVTPFDLSQIVQAK